VVIAFALNVVIKFPTSVEYLVLLFNVQKIILHYKENKILITKKCQDQDFAEELDSIQI